MSIYIEISGGKRIEVEGKRVNFSDRHGDHAGVVAAYCRTSDQSGTESSRRRMVFRVACDDGCDRELRPHELRDIIEAQEA